MISLREFEPFMSREQPIPPPGAELEPLAEYIMSVSDFHSWIKDSEGRDVALYRLTKSVGGLPASAIVTRDFLRDAHARGVKYGSVTVPAVKPKDFEVVE